MQLRFFSEFAKVFLLRGFQSARVLDWTLKENWIRISDFADFQLRGEVILF